MSLYGPGPVRKFGYVLRDIHVAMDHWVRILGVEPFFFDDAPVEDSCYRGVLSAARMSVAFVNTDLMRIELVPYPSPSPFNDFLGRCLEGQRHMAFWHREFEHWVDHRAHAGVAVLMSNYTGAPDGRFAYVVTKQHPGMIIEISQVQGRKAQFFIQVARPSDTWNGGNPVRAMKI